MSDDSKRTRNRPDEATDVMRQRLRDYMADHGIGVPALCQRINESLGLDSGSGQNGLALKTLQRFLAGHRLRDDILHTVNCFVTAIDQEESKDG